MSLPEIQRILLLVAIGICAWLLVRAWVTDSEERNRALREARDSMYSEQVDADQTDAESTGQDTAPLPLQSEEQPFESDVPDASLAQFDELGASSQSGEFGGPQELVTVATPLMEVKIDSQGGDVVSVKLKRYPVAYDEPDVPMTLLYQRANIRQQYIAQSGLFGEDGFDRRGLPRPVYRSALTNWNVETGALEVPLTFEREGVFVTKRYTFDAERYDIGVRYDISNRSDREFNATFFAQIKRDDAEDTGEGSNTFRYASYLGAAISTNEDRYKKLRMKEDLRNDPYLAVVSGGWIAFLQHYFLTAWIPEPTGEFNYFARRGPQDNFYRFGFTAPIPTIRDGTTASYGATFYAGPKDQEALEQLAPNLALTVDYGFFWWLSVPLFNVLSWIHGFVGNWGVAIILLTLLIKTVLFPLSAMSYRNMAKMRKVSPQMKKLQERYGNDKQKFGQEMMALYKREKANPLSGCFPMLLQMPVFFALYWVLIESVELRQAPFMLWMQDLGSLDPWFVLPALNAGSMFLMQRLNPPMPDPMQQKIMMMMPIMFGVICIWMPSGLVLYWLVNNLYSMAHHYYALRKVGPPATST